MSSAAADPILEPASFSGWLAEWGAGLWFLIEGEALPDDTNSEDFIEILERVRGLPSRRTAGSHLARTRAFISEWIKRERNKADRQRIEERVVLYGLFRLGWSPETVRSALGGWSASSLRYRAFEALKRGAGLELEALRYASRDCARADTEFLGDRVGLEWPDPLGTGRREEVNTHVASCVRCRRIRRALESEIERLSKSRLPSIPSSFFTEIEENRSLSARVGFLRAFARWPWFLRVPLQLAFAYALVFVVLAVPYIEDLVPRWAQFRKQIVSLVIEKEAPEAREGKTASALQAAMPEFAALPPEPLPPAVAQILEPKSLATRGSPDREDLETLLRALEPSSDSLTRRSGPDRISDRRARAVPADLVASAAAATSAATTTRSSPPLPLAAPSAAVQPVTEPAPVKAVLRPEPSPPAQAVDRARLEKRFFRWGAFTSRLSEDGDKILAILTKYGAEKAGDLALGAPYRGGKYFHFSASAELMGSIETEIKALGLGSFTQEETTSWRRTPLDRRRVVFVLQPAASANQAPTASASPMPDDS